MCVIGHYLMQIATGKPQRLDLNKETSIIDHKTLKMVMLISCNGQEIKPRALW